MGVTVKVNGSSNSIVHKGSTGIAKSTLPDVCKTPSPAGPVPIPYPIIVSMSSDLANGSTTVKADGKMIGVKGCEFSMCTGDEAGTAGGVVSSTFKKEAKFILFSFDVKIDGKNACRKGDKMTMNHQNTVCMSGETQVPVAAQPAHTVMQKMVNDCDASVDPEHKKPHKKAGQKKSCTKLGTDKHKCVDDKIKKHCAENPPDGNPPMDPEKGYPRPELGPNDSCPIPTPTTPAPSAGRDAAIATNLGKGMSFIAALINAISKKCFPDAAIHMGGGRKMFVDFKFPCPAGHPTGRGTSKGGANTAMSPAQQASYDTLGRGTGGRWASIVIKPGGVG